MCPCGVHEANSRSAATEKMRKRREKQNYTTLRQYWRMSGVCSVAFGLLAFMLDRMSDSGPMPASDPALCRKRVWSWPVRLAMPSIQPRASPEA